MAMIPPRPATKNESAAGVGGDEDLDFYVSHVVYPLHIAAGLACIFTGIGLIVTMSMLLHAQVSLACRGLTALGGVFLPLGFALIVLGVVVLRFWSIRQGPPDPTPTLVLIALRVVGLLVACATYLGLAVVCLIGAAFYIMSVNLPDITINYSDVNGLQANVMIQRDGLGMPHINASSISDAMFGQGFVVAQDRLAQVELLRLTASGQLSQYTGSSSFGLDAKIRSAGLHLSGDQMCAAMTAGNQALWQRYVDGINFFLQVDPNRPPEFMFWGRLFVFHEPQPYTLTDLCRMFRLMQWQMTSNVDGEMYRWKLFANSGLTYTQILDLWPLVGGVNNVTMFSDADMGYTALDKEASLAREALDFTLEAELYQTVMGQFRNNMTPTNGGTEPTIVESGTQGLLEFFSAAYFEQTLLHSKGSDAWAVRSPGGAAVIASDLHLPASLPGFLYTISIIVTYPNGSTWVAAGATLPGLPGLLNGRINDVAWGITMSQADLSDLYVMNPDPANPSTNYLHNGSSVPYSVREETIDIYGQSSVTITVYESLYGPDIAPFWGLSSIHRICIASRATQQDNTTINGFANLMTPGVVSTVADIRNYTFALVQAPGFAVAIGDRFGTIGFALAGLSPIRALGHTGRVPTFGNGSYDYIGSVPFAAMPAVINSNTAEAGSVACANVRPVPYGFPYQLGYSWSPPYRQRKIQAAISQAVPTEFSNVSWSLELLLDTQSVVWSLYIGPLLQAGTPFSDEFIPLLDSNGQALLQELQRWDGSTAIGVIAPSRLWKFLTTLAMLPGSAVLDEIGFYAMEPHVYGVHILVDPSAATNASCSAAMGGNGTCVTYAAQVWNSVAATPDLVWGIQANQLSLRSRAWYGTVIECLFDRSCAKGGDYTTINAAAAYPQDIDAAQTALTVPVMRLVVDWSDDTMIYVASSGGASGSPFSPFYWNTADTYNQPGYFTVGIFSYQLATSQELLTG